MKNHGYLFQPPSRVEQSGTGTCSSTKCLFSVGQAEEAFMPVLLLWAVPAVIVVGGAGYWLIHMH
jgi:hypothetical protein